MDKGDDYDYRIYFQTLDQTGAKIGDALYVSDEAGNAWKQDFTWADSGYGISWNDESATSPQIYFTFIALCP